MFKVSRQSLQLCGQSPQTWSSQNQSHTGPLTIGLPLILFQRNADGVFVPVGLSNYGIKLCFCLQTSFNLHNAVLFKSFVRIVICQIFG